jgi:ADP-ribosylglycohydrolase
MNELKGCVFGSALADAIRLTTEFKRKSDVTNITFPYKYSIRGWEPNDWTDDTDQMILFIELIIEKNLTQMAFAKKLLNWSQHGFNELGDTVGQGLGGSTTMVLIDTKFLEYPERVAINVWENGGCAIAPNGSLMRSAVLSFTDRPIKNSIQMCKVTHADPRCVASCIILNVAICLIRAGSTTNLRNDSIKYGIKYLNSVNSKCVPHKVRGVPNIWIDSPYFDSTTSKYDYESEMRDVCHKSNDLANLKLDEIGKIGYVCKCLGCAFWAMYHIENRGKKALDYLRLIKLIALEGGDADTNAIVAGSLLGTYLGYDELYKQCNV